MGKISTISGKLSPAEIRKQLDTLDTKLVVAAL